MPLYKISAGIPYTVPVIYSEERGIQTGAGAQKCGQGDGASGKWVL